MPYNYSDVLDDPVLYERQESFRGGMNAFQRPVLLEPDQSQLLQNIIIGNDHTAKIRPGADALGDAAIDSNTTKIQGAVYYDTESAEAVLAVVGTKLYEWGGSSWTEKAGWTANAATDRVSMVQAIDKVYLTDGVGNVHSWDGTNYVDLGTAGANPPICQILCWHTNRMFYAGIESLPDTVQASDLLDPGMNSEAEFSFRVGAGDGDPIRGLASLQGWWLAVLKENSLWMVNTDPQAEHAADWTVEHLTTGIGLVGMRAFCVFGNDILFLAQDGIRSLRRMAAAGGQWEVSAPLSEFLEPWVKRINWQYANLSCAVKYREFALFAVPIDSATEPSHVFVWNGRTQSWVGVWAGWEPHVMLVSRFSGNDRLLIGDADARVNQWKDQDDDELEATFEDNGTDVDWLIRTRALQFGEPISNKDPWFAEVRFKDSIGTATAKAFLDDVQEAEWTVTMNEDNTVLPVVIPFTLSTAKPTAARKGLSGLNLFNEMYLEISGSGQPMTLKNWTVGAFLNTVENE